ncbi:YjbH domain-containing protein [Ruegeria arenilitoris]|uniref:YjbH domain-containing protein n=2 Tax=Ruegeria arenilitoris TaxID=1173585 RepID=UPI00147F34E9|nr:YjbH domain-containing protein [Ruegeria arenilitoris]
MGQAQSVSTYGTPGLLEIPTAEMFDDGALVFTAAGLRNSGRGTMTFQMLPWVHGSFRYAVIDRLDGPDTTRYDRSFDIHFRLREESRHSPAIVMGLRDFGGTGVYAAEYFVATKTIQDRLKLTGGIGWGRMAGRGAFSNPLGVFGSRFDTRPPPNSNGQGGELEFGNWFRGDAALFGGASWQYNDRLTFLAEYSPDLYSQEAVNDSFRVRSPINVGVQYRFDNGTQLTTSYLYGSTLGLTLSYFVDPRKSVAPGGQGAAPPPLQPRSQTAAATADRATGDIRSRMQAALAQEGLRLVYLSETGDTVQVGVENTAYGQAAQALGRTARVLTNEEPAQTEHFDIALMSNGVPLSAVRVNRDDLYELEHDPDNAWRSFARAEVSDTLPLVQGGILTDAYPHFSYRFGPYLNFSFFDPDDPLRYEVGAALGLDYTLSPGFTLSTGLRLPILSTLDDSTRVSDSPLPHVRSDWAIYARESNLRIEHMTGEYLWRPGTNLYARTTLGYLETMFGGLSAELLWYPTNSRLALGAEANYAVQRDFDVLFGFQDYSVATGHVSAYYDLPGEYHAQVDVGRYLAGDYGATFTLDREFNNGFKVGAFFTLTNVSSEEFGEGSFDKGIRLEIPVSWLTGRPSRNKIAQTIRPVLRDGGARLHVRNRLYGVTREARAQNLSRGWGRFWR